MKGSYLYPFLEVFCSECSFFLANLALMSYCAAPNCSVNESGRMKP